MNPRRHTYLAQRILWSARQFLQVETPPLHLGGVEACDFPKCGKLGSIICESWGLRSRSPLNQNWIFASSLCSLLPHLYIAVESKNNQFILPSNFSCSSDQSFFFIFCLTFIFEPMFQNKQSNNSHSFCCWSKKQLPFLKGVVYRQFDWSARQHDSTSLLGLLAKIKV